MRILVTGVAGFIGMHVAARLLNEGYEVAGLDNLNDYYDVQLKLARLKQIENDNQFSFHQISLEHVEHVQKIFEEFSPQVVINLAAQAGVRYSIENPKSYIDSNVVGFANILELSKNFKVKHFLYASSSSVYGANARMPFSEAQSVEHPLALYGATKKANELFAHSYSHLFDLPTTGLRFFTVYGPWGRPDMALFKFTKSIINDEEIEVYNHGNMVRDFTYIDDIVEGIVRLVEKPAESSAAFEPCNPDPGSSNAPWRVFNIGNGQPVKLMDYIECIEEVVGKTSRKVFLEMQLGDVVATSSSTERLEAWVGYKPSTPIKVGVRKFVDWYRKYYNC